MSEYLPSPYGSDIIQYEKEIGGLSRACTVLNNLTELLDFTKTPDTFFETVSTATIQRLGYLLENVVESPDLANQRLKSGEIKYHGKQTNKSNRI